jgi:flagellar biosynthesis protein FlhG
MGIWAVAGGKGGTGKSLIAHGLAQALAERGSPVVLVDADFGGPNQHTYCGIRKPQANLAQFFADKRPLQDLLVETSCPGLRLVPGTLDSADTDGITWAQKQKFFRHLRSLPADHVLLDLGGGSQYDTLDSFLVADIQVGVIVPDALAIENFYLFLKNLKRRQLANVISRAGLGERARNIWSSRAELGIANAGEFVQHLCGLSAPFAQAMAHETRRLFLHVVLNQVREYGQVEFGQAVKSSMAKYFHLEGQFAGYIRYDKDLWQQFGHDHPGGKGEPSYTLHHAMQGILDGILGHPRQAIPGGG